MHKLYLLFMSENILVNIPAYVDVRRYIYIYIRHFSYKLEIFFSFPLGGGGGGVTQFGILYSLNAWPVPKIRCTQSKHIFVFNFRNQPLKTRIEKHFQEL